MAWPKLRASIPKVRALRRRASRSRHCRVILSLGLEGLRTKNSCGALSSSRASRTRRPCCPHERACLGSDLLIIRLCGLSKNHVLRGHDNPNKGLLKIDQEAEKGDDYDRAPESLSYHHSLTSCAEATTTSKRIRVASPFEDSSYVCLQ